MQIRPFQGYRFDARVVGDVGRCMAPPYDVIDESMQQRLYDRSEYNVVRITRGKTSSRDDECNNQYTRAAGHLDEWIRSGVLKQDPRETIYGYVQDFHMGDLPYRRTGLIALGQLEEPGRGVQPHERTLDGPKADRLRLMHAKAAQFGQIFMLYDDLQRLDEQVMARAAARPALLDFIDDNKVRHRLYAIDESEDMQRLAKMMSTKQVVIADGHHRYETALEYYRRTQNPAARFRMMTFVNMRNDGLLILPTHRLVRDLSAFNASDLLKALGQRFDVIDLPLRSGGKADACDDMFAKMRDWHRQGRNAFGLYMGNGSFHALMLRDEAELERVAPELSPASRALDVNVLHKLVLEALLGIGEQQLASESNLEYIKDLGTAIARSIEKVDQGQCQAVFFMNPTRVEQVKAVAAAGERMPQKSTFFYPKIYTGLVMHKL